MERQSYSTHGTGEIIRKQSASKQRCTENKIKRKIKIIKKKQIYILQIIRPIVKLRNPANTHGVKEQNPKETKRIILRIDDVDFIGAETEEKSRSFVFRQVYFKQKRYCLVFEALLSGIDDKPAIF